MAELRVVIDLRINGEPVASFPRTKYQTGEVYRLDRTHDTADEQNSDDGGFASPMTALVFDQASSVDLGASGMTHAFDTIENACVVFTDGREISYDPTIGTRVRGIW